MKRILIYILLFIIFTTCHKAEFKDSLVWEISGKGLMKKSYLFGTFHYMPVQAFYFPYSLHKLVKSADVLVMGASKSSLDSVYHNQSKDIIFLPDGKTYADYLSPNAYADMRNFMFDNLAVNDSMFSIFERLKPMYAETKLTRLYFGLLKSYDYYLFNLADGYEKKVIGLDNKSQIAGYSEKYYKFDNPSKFWRANDSTGYKKIRAYKKLVFYYLHQRIEGLDSLMRADSDFPDLDSVIIKERNDRWMPEIEKVVNKQSAFIAVGARHLSGKNGLINRLRKERYIVKPVYI